MDQAEYREVLGNFLRDNPRINKLIKGTEYSPEELDLALVSALDDYNSTPPPINIVSFANFPSPYLLLMGAAVQALKFATFSKLRNQLSYNDSGLAVDEDSQGPAYMSMYNMLYQEYEQKKLKIKRAININRCYGGTSSEYSLIYPYTNRNIK